MKIGSREIGAGHKPWIVAEIGANHNGSLERALKLIAVAKECGADAVKFQAYTPDSMTIDCDKPDFIIKGTPWDGRKLYDLYKEAATPREWLPMLFGFAHGLGMHPFASVFSPEDVDFIERFQPRAYKISSFEISDIPLIEYTARKGKPLIISTGMASDDDIFAAVRGINLRETVLLHCVSAYPADPKKSALWKLMRMSRIFKNVGLSDHTLGATTAVISTALGACIIEKHLTLSRTDGGPDAAFSSDPVEFAEMVRKVHDAWEAIYGYADEAEDDLKPLRRSLYAVADIKAGEEFTSQNIRSIRPGYGLPPSRLPKILWRKSAMDIERGIPLSEEMIS